ncbi:hypothetical protein U27_06489 [Candidatus Vecturithrix granuli]|uniref:Uncharacterized protein n=1 Tax=Vecturithrix granuli TaxID=1499967 RepID=A0A081C4J9_VECG1|nr:hypothetical protein U27_06489 [Candidatus Vecturithrix granuli]
MGCRRLTGVTYPQASSQWAAIPLMSARSLKKSWCAGSPLHTLNIALLSGRTGMQSSVIGPPPAGNGGKNREIRPEPGFRPVWTLWMTTVLNNRSESSANMRSQRSFDGWLRWTITLSNPRTRFRCRLFRSAATRLPTPSIRPLWMTAAIQSNGETAGLMRVGKKRKKKIGTARRNFVILLDFRIIRWSACRGMRQRLFASG